MKISQPDHVDRVISQWTDQRLGIDAEPFEVVGRIGRAAHLLDAAVEANLGKYGLSRWGWDILTALRRSGPPYRLTPTSLYRSLMRTSGAVSNRLNRLEEQGLVRRLPDPADGRGVIVELTAAGRLLVEKVLASHLETERRSLSALSRAEQRDLQALLRKLLVDLESKEGEIS